MRNLYSRLARLTNVVAPGAPTGAVPGFARTRLAATMMAAAGPIVAVWALQALPGYARELMPSRGSESRLERLSDYITAPQADGTPAIAAGHVLWSGTPSGRNKWFEDLMLVGGNLVIVGDHMAVAVDAHTGVVVDRRNLTTESPSMGGVTSVGVDATPEAAWLYSFSSGHAVEYMPARHALGTSVKLNSALLSVNAISPAHLLTSGMFDREILRDYLLPATPAVPADSGGQATVAARIGRALFPGLVDWIANQLDMTSVAVEPEAHRAAVAWRWSNRIDFYDVQKLRLERSVAGPVETRLSFDTPSVGSRKLFSLAGDSAYTYVDIAAGPHLVLALHSGREKGKYGSNFGLGADVQAFTWNGQYIGTWRLPEPLQKIHLDEQTQVLYGLRRSPQPSVVAYDVSAIVTRAVAEAAAARN